MGQLDGCFAKLDRAREHVAELHAAQNAYFDPRPFDVRGSFDSASNLYTFVAQVTREPPLRVGLVVGDLVHNLRSALDHLVWQLVIANRIDPETLDRPFPVFPVCKKEEDWPSLRGSVLRCVADDHAGLIRAFQPFVTHSLRPADAPLAQLHDLWNEDKHRIVTPTNAAIGALPSGDVYIKTPVNPKDVQVIPVRDVAMVHEAWSFWGTPLDGHAVAEARITPSGPAPEMELKGRSIAGLCVLDRQPLNHVVAHMGGSVEKLLIAFRAILDAAHAT